MNVHFVLLQSNNWHRILWAARCPGHHSSNTNNNNNDNSHDNVYGAVIMTKVIARVHKVYLMNVD